MSTSPEPSRSDMFLRKSGWFENMHIFVNLEVLRKCQKSRLIFEWYGYCSRYNNLIVQIIAVIFGTFTTSSRHSINQICQLVNWSVLTFKIMSQDFMDISRLLGFQTYT